jgi:hypothetical protein
MDSRHEYDAGRVQWEADQFRGRGVDGIDEEGIGVVDSVDSLVVAYSPRTGN